MVRTSISFLLSVSLLLFCPYRAGVASDSVERSWKVQYFGGAIDVSQKNERWKNTLTISGHRILLQLESGASIEIDPAQIIAVGYAGIAMHREGTAAALIVAGAAAPGIAVLFAAKSTSHFIGLEFVSKDGVKTGVLLRAHKGDYKEIVESLQSLTSLAESAAEQSP